MPTDEVDELQALSWFMKSFPKRAREARKGAEFQKLVRSNGEIEHVELLYFKSGKAYCRQPSGRVVSKRSKYLWVERVDVSARFMASKLLEDIIRDTVSAETARRAIVEATPTPRIADVVVSTPREIDAATSPPPAREIILVKDILDSIVYTIEHSAFRLQCSGDLQLHAPHNCTKTIKRCRKTILALKY